MPTTEEVQRLAKELTKKLSDDGKVIQGGWVGYMMVTMHPDAPEIQKEECRIAFYAGAQHLFSSIMVILDSGLEPTDKDMKRISLIHHELEAFIEEFKQKHGLRGTDGPPKFQG